MKLNKEQKDFVHQVLADIVIKISDEVYNTQGLNKKELSELYYDISLALSSSVLAFALSKTISRNHFEQAIDSTASDIKEFLTMFVKTLDLQHVDIIH